MPCCQNVLPKLCIRNNKLIWHGQFCPVLNRSTLSIPPNTDKAAVLPTCTQQSVWQPLDLTMVLNWWIEARTNKGPVIMCITWTAIINLNATEVLDMIIVNWAKIQLNSVGLQIPLMFQGVSFFKQQQITSINVSYVNTTTDVHLYQLSPLHYP